MAQNWSYGWPEGLLRKHEVRPTDGAESRTWQCGRPPVGGVTIPYGRSRAESALRASGCQGSFAASVRGPSTERANRPYSLSISTHALDRVLCGYSKGSQLDTAPHTVPGEPTLANVPLHVATTMQSMHSFASSPTLASSGMAALMPGWMHVLEVRLVGVHHGELEESHGAGGPQ